MIDAKHTLIVGLIIAIAIFAYSAGQTNPTGAAIVKNYQSPIEDRSQETYANTLHDQAKEFFGVSEIIFPQGVCIPAAHELYGNVAYNPVDVSAGYETTGLERLATKSFVIDRHERYGTIDFVKTPTFLADREVDSLISISSEAIVRVPKASRTTYLVMDLFANTIGPFMYINRGRFSTPTTDCVFVVKNKEAYCDCDIHTIKGIAIGGVTFPAPVEDRYKQIVEQAEQKILETGSLENSGIAVSKLQ